MLPSLCSATIIGPIVSSIHEILCVQSLMLPFLVSLSFLNVRNTCMRQFVVVYKHVLFHAFEENIIVAKAAIC